MRTPLSHPFYISAKAALAALLALTVVNALGIEDKLSATFVAVVCTSPTVFNGVRRGLGQLVGSFLGGTVTLVLMQWAPRSLTLVAALFVTIWASFLIRIGSDYVVAAFTVLYVLLIPGEAAHTLEHRMASVLTGVLSALVVNLIVSFLRRRAVFRRRLRIARELVAEELERAAAALVRPPDPARSDETNLFEPVFRTLRLLADELGDASREFLSSRRWKTQVKGAERATQQLLAVAHYGKDTAFTWADGSTALPEAAAAMRALAAAIRAQRPFDFPLLSSTPELRSLPGAAAAWNRALQGLETFAAAPAQP